MPKGSEELTNARKEEIIDACASLYETMSFRDITIRDIGEKTSFTRTSIYNYFRTKEEIFLALLTREHRAWTEDLEALMPEGSSSSHADFADGVAHTLEKRACMLKLMSMNIYDMEVNSRIDNLVEFKKEYACTIEAIASCIKRFFPDINDVSADSFIYSFFPFLFGIYPYTTATEKQEEAMKLAGVDPARHSIYGLVYSFVMNTAFFRFS